MRPATFDIELRSGGYLHLDDPDPTLICFDDVAHGLSNICRFTGQCRRFYSVAEHAVLVSVRLMIVGAPTEVQLAGLHHDDSEAFLTDISRPLKLLLPGYRELEQRMSACVRQALGVQMLPFDDARVKEADDWALAAEAYHLMPSRGSEWFVDGLYDAADFTAPRLFDVGVTPGQARKLFTERHELLAGKR